MSRSEAYNLFLKTLNIVNSALFAHKDRIPYRQMLAAFNKRFDGQNIGVAVYTDDPDTPHDHVTIRLDDHRFVIVSHGRQEPEFAWKIPEEHLKQVNANPQYYIEHPSALNWDWMTARIGIDVPSEFRSSGG